VYYDCYAGCGVPSYNGSTVIAQQIPGEVGDALPSSGTGVLNSGDLFDFWWFNNTLCHVTNGTGGGWSADTGGSVTQRGSGYTQLGRPSAIGFLVNANVITHCYNGATDQGPMAANRGTYLGTCAMVSAGTTSYTFGSAASGGGAAFFGCWNYYNRVTVTTNVSDTQAPYSYAGGTPRSPNNSGTNKITFVFGVAEDNITGTYVASMTTAATAGAYGIIGLGFDTLTSFSCQTGIVYAPTSALMSGTPNVSCAWVPTAGLHTLWPVEASDNTATNVFNASSANNLSASLRN
jgi:hypothetical protein